MSSRRWKPCASSYGVNVLTLAVFDQLPFERLCVVDIDDAGGNGKQLGKVRGAVASRSCNDLEALVIGTHSEGLNQAVVPDGLGKLVQLGLIEGAAGVGGGFVNGVDGEKLECAAVLHGCSP